MTKKHTSPHTQTHRIRMGSFLLAVIICVGITSFPACAYYNPGDKASGSEQTDPSTNTPVDPSTNTPTNPSTDATEHNSSVMPTLNISAGAALIVGTGRGMTLYKNSENVRANYSAASKLMTAVIALENLPIDTQVTISNEVEALDEKAANPLSLSKGEKCSVKFLVTALIYMDSDAAAFSLAEYISGNEPAFVERMNETAKALNMSSTLFANTSGDLVIPTYPSPTDETKYGTYLSSYTTVSDLSSLFRYALNIQEFRDLFTKYKALMFLSDGSPRTITSTMSSAWGLNVQLKGAAKFENDDNGSTSCILALASVDDFEIGIILGGSTDDFIYQDLYKAINTTYSFYQVSDLVVAGDTYRDVSIPGISNPITAVFGSTVRYIHPAGNDYIKPNAVFTPSESVTLPVSVGQSLGQVRFELEDGTLIDTEVVAAEGMWAKSDFLSDSIALLKANSNLSVVIGIAIFFFLASVMRTFILLIRKQIRVKNSK